MGSKEVAEEVQEESKEISHGTWSLAKRSNWHDQTSTQEYSIQQTSKTSSWTWWIMEKNTMQMPGTLGGAKIVFTEKQIKEGEVKTYRPSDEFVSKQESEAFAAGVRWAESQLRNK
jgi:hypothetical protein